MPNDKSEKPKDVNITIDKEHVQSPNPTTGQALYILGHVEDGFDLYRETKGKGDDELIKNSTTGVTVHNGDHFFTSQRSLNPGTQHDARRG
jgi:hypothetical protein